VLGKSEFGGMHEKEVAKARDMFCTITKKTKQQTVQRIGFRESRRW
jgi:hypothetical protein